MFTIDVHGVDVCDGIVVGATPRDSRVVTVEVAHATAAGRTVRLGQSVGVSIGAGVVAGGIAGLLWGGVGGRIAMRVTFLTSNESVRGITSDDGFEIGVFSGETVALLVFATILGVMAGVVVGLVRPFLAGRSLPTAGGVGVATGLGAGASIVRADGVDFVFLDPLWLTVGLFVFLPAAWGATVVIAIDGLVTRFDPTAPRASPPRWVTTVAWIAVGAPAVAGLLDLLGDIRELTRLR